MNTLPSLTQYGTDLREGEMDRRATASFWKTDVGQKIIVALAVPFILAVAAYASGMIELPGRVRQLEGRQATTENDVRTLRESQIRAEESFKYIEESLTRIERGNERRR